MSDEQWGPWIDHDGSNYPVPVGTVVQAVRGNKSSVVCVVRHLNPYHNAWLWESLSDHTLDQRVVKYRIRKPKGLTMLENILAEVETKQPKVYVDVEV